MTTKTPEALDVLDRLIDYIDPDGHTYHFNEVEQVRKVRAVFDELIESAKEASGTLGHAYHTVLDGELAEYAHTDYQRLDAALDAVEVLPK